MPIEAATGASSEAEGQQQRMAAPRCSCRVFALWFTAIQPIQSNHLRIEKWYRRTAQTRGGVAARYSLISVAILCADQPHNSPTRFLTCPPLPTKPPKNRGPSSRHWFYAASQLPDSPSGHYPVSRIASHACAQTPAPVLSAKCLAPDLGYDSLSNSGEAGR